MSQYLVLTAMGSDRTGIVSGLTKLASKCGCNIVDSRMAIFGQEFTFIMLLDGDAKAINIIENKIPAEAAKLDLITMMKRTSDYKLQDLTNFYQVDFSAIDQPGILKSVTAFFATRNIDISSLKSNIDKKNSSMSASIYFALTQESSIDELEKDFYQLCQQIDVQGCIKKADAHAL